MYSIHSTVLNQVHRKTACRIHTEDFLAKSMDSFSKEVNFLSTFVKKASGLQRKGIKNLTKSKELAKNYIRYCYTYFIIFVCCFRSKISISHRVTYNILHLHDKSSNGRQNQDGIDNTFWLPVSRHIKCLYNWRVNYNTIQVFLTDDLMVLMISFTHRVLLVLIIPIHP